MAGQPFSVTTRLQRRLMRCRSLVKWIRNGLPPMCLQADLAVNRRLLFPDFEGQVLAHRTIVQDQLTAPCFCLLARNIQDQLNPSRSSHRVRLILSVWFFPIDDGECSRAARQAGGGGMTTAASMERSGRDRLLSDRLQRLTWIPPTLSLDPQHAPLVQHAAHPPDPSAIKIRRCDRNLLVANSCHCAEVKVSNT